MKAALAALLIIALAAAPSVGANGVDGQYYLEGIGYREQELQVAKTGEFASEDADGVDKASYAGGTHIFIKGVGLVKDNPEAHTIMMESHEFQQQLQAPAMTQDDGFNSHPMTGRLAYRTPSLGDLFQMDRELFDHYTHLTFWISVIAHHELLE